MFIVFLCAPCRSVEVCIQSPCFMPQHAAWALFSLCLFRLLSCDLGQHAGRPSAWPYRQLRPVATVAVGQRAVQAGESIFQCKKWNSLQGGQVHYTDAEHQIIAGGLQLCLSFTRRLWKKFTLICTVYVSLQLCSGQGKMQAGIFTGHLVDPAWFVRGQLQWRSRLVAAW